MAFEPPPADFSDRFYNQQRRKAQVKDQGRGSFIPRSEGPGPAAYCQATDPIKQTAPRGVFGTSNRENEAARFISQLHNKSLPVTDTPGPGTYRVASDSRKRSGPAGTFGSAEQRPDPEKVYPQAKIPGPIYSQELPPLGPAVVFAPLGSLELGRTRSRYDDRRLFLSADHALVDRSGTQHEYVQVGPAKYDVEGAYKQLSSLRLPPATVFGKSKRGAGASMTEEQVRHEPASSTAADVPGPIYEYKSTLTEMTTGFTKAPQIYAGEKGSSTAGPYISRGHEPTMYCSNGPGPGVYDIKGGRGKAVSGLGDAPQYPFGLLPKVSETSEMRRTVVPGPGAYKPNPEKLSSVAAAPGFSMAANLRTDWVSLAPGKDAPGPGSYNVVEAARIEAKRPPAFSMGGQAKGGRDSFVQPSITPGPIYDASVNASPKRGFTFGTRDKVKDDKAVRYLGAYAKDEGYGTESPGPIYDTARGGLHLSGSKSPPRIRMATSKRDASSKVFISRQHAEAEGMGLDSPGPGAYDHNQKELAEVTSRFKKPAAAVFSSGPRFGTHNGY